MRQPGTKADYEKRLHAFDELNRRLNISSSTQHNDIPKSAPAPTHARDSPHNEGQATNDDSNKRLSERKDGDRRVSYIDNYRLRQWLEELYRDKKYFDQFVEAAGLLNVYFIVQIETCHGNTFRVP